MKFNISTETNNQFLPDKFRFPYFKFKMCMISYFMFLLLSSILLMQYNFGMIVLEIPVCLQCSGYVFKKKNWRIEN